MDRLLNEREINEILDSHCLTSEADVCDRHIAEAQLAKTDKEWVEWAFNPCDKHPKSRGYLPLDKLPADSDMIYYMSRRVDCDGCIAERKKEIGI